MKRIIPSTMASQHPDHAGKPYWHENEFIGTQDEYKECYLNFTELGIDEYKWDWEGKFVDESVIERLLDEYFEYFKKFPIGKKKFLTFRLPNPKVETEFRIGRAFFGILGAAALTKKVGLHSPPLFEVILPMTETADELIAIHDAFKEMSSLKHALYRFDNNLLETLELIPLFEQVETIMNSHLVLKKYSALYKKRTGRKPAYLRPYIARSDPALNSGIVPTVLAVKVGLSNYQIYSEKSGIPLYPIIGSASLPFRGGLTPETIEQFVAEYQGIKTALLQSGFRYDYDQKQVIEAIKKLHLLLPKGKAHIIPKKDEKAIRSIIPIFEGYYRSTIEEIAPIINKTASFLPKRRERVQHVGLFGYSRGVGKVTLPRAIGFTAALYSLGVPPELIGTGRGIKELIKKKKIHLLEKYYINVKSDLLRAGAFLNRQNLRKLAKTHYAWKEIEEDIKGIEEYLGQELAPHSKEEKEHVRLTERILMKVRKNEAPTRLLKQAGILRKSLG